MKKLIKVVIGMIIVLVVLALAVVLTLPFTIDPLVKTAASTMGPKLLGVPVSVEKVSLNPFAGRLVISCLVVGNPQGYSDKPACAVDRVDVDLKMTSLLGDVIVVEKIQVDAPAISYETREGASNFDTIQANVGKASEADTNQPPADAKAAKKKPGKKVIIELFTLNGAQVSYSSGMTFGNVVTLLLPPVTIRDIGKDTSGVSSVDAVTQIFNAITAGLGQAVTASVGQASEALKGLLKDSGEMGQDVADTASGAAKGFTDAASDAAKGASDAASEAAKELKNIFK